MSKNKSLENEQERQQRRLLDVLAELGGARVTDDDLIREGKQLILPETMSPREAIEFLKRHIAQQEEVTAFDRTFRFRPHDGAHALQAALRKVFGHAGIGQAQYTLFGGKIPPQMISINIGPNQTEQVPWGTIEFAPLKGEIHLTEKNDKQMGPLFRLVIEAPRKYRAAVEGLFIAIENELAENSIYKGRAIDGQTIAEFLDLRGVDERKVVYSDEVIVQLSANVWSLLRYTDRMREEGLPLKRSVLLHGPYGTGKTLAAFLTAKEAEAHGWTFIYCRPGKDDLDTVMSTAKLYQPAVVFFEDVDVLAESGEKDTVTQLLDTFDGITAKGTEIIAVLTTNHIDRIHKAMVRPGRLDALVEISDLDRNGIERLIKATVPTDQLDENIDYDRVAEAMQDFLPAFVRESIDRARRYNLDRNEGKPGSISTDDLVHAATGLRPQLDLMNDAGEGRIDDRVGTALTKVVREVLDDTQIELPRLGEDAGSLVEAGNGSARVK